VDFGQPAVPILMSAAGIGGEHQELIAHANAEALLGA